jgi:hypothetical protein
MIIKQHFRAPGSPVGFFRPIYFLPVPELEVSKPFIWLRFEVAYTHNLSFRGLFALS